MGPFPITKASLTVQTNNLTTQIANLEKKITSDSAHWTSEFQAMEQAQAQVTQQLSYLTQRRLGGAQGLKPPRAIKFSKSLISLLALLVVRPALSNSVSGTPRISFASNKYSPKMFLSMAPRCFEKYPGASSCFHRLR